MHSDLPKVLQPLAGKPLLQHVVDTARSLQPAALHVVYGHGGEQVRAALVGQEAAARPWPGHQVVAAGAAAGHWACRAAGHAGDPGRSPGAGAVRRRAAAARGNAARTGGAGLGQAAGAADREAGGSHRLRSRGARAWSREVHRRTEGRDARAAATARRQHRRAGGAGAPAARVAGQAAHRTTRRASSISPTSSPWR